MNLPLAIYLAHISNFCITKIFKLVDNINLGFKNIKYNFANIFINFNNFNIFNLFIISILKVTMTVN